MGSIDVMKNWLIIYDICDKDRLCKVAKILEDYGTRVQKSVFEVITTRRVIDVIKNRVKKVIDEGEDFVVYFDLCNQDWQKQIKYGPGKYKVMEEKEFYII